MNRIETVPADDLTLREVNSGGSPRGGGSFRLSQAVAAEREETRKRLSRELLEGNNRTKTTNNDDNADDDDNDDNENEEDYEEEEDEDEEDEGGLFGMGPPTGGGMKMSLMDLLEQTDRQAGIDGPTYRLDDGEEEDEEEAEDELEDDGKDELCCCVCKVKHKGCAFIHCGHTYCRLCSKELCVEKGNCPLCNDFVVEVLDVL